MILTILLFLSSAHSTPLCHEETTRLTCRARTAQISSGRFTQREMLWQLPQGPAPLRGYPAVIISQGSWFPVEFSRVRGLPMGGFNEIRLIRTLLENGYAVLAPRATLRVGWTTNLPLPDYEKTSDFHLFTELLKGIDGGQFGNIDRQRLYAVGISSGGYNTSRLAITFPGRFRAIAIQSASYASCFGPLCQMPDEISAEHPPTLMLHGERDLTVPIKTARKFYRYLKQRGIEARFVTDPDMGHGWLESSPAEVLSWFNRF